MNTIDWVKNRLKEKKFELKEIDDNYLPYDECCIGDKAYTQGEIAGLESVLEFLEK